MNIYSPSRILGQLRVQSKHKHSLSHPAVCPYMSRMSILYRTQKKETHGKGVYNDGPTAEDINQIIMGKTH